ncbi:AAA family ATPase [Trichothermofontia sp.]
MSTATLPQPSLNAHPGPDWATVPAALLPLCQAIAEGKHALLLSGRNLRDLDCNPQTHRIAPLLEILRDQLRDRWGMLLVTYSRAEGIDYAALDLSDADRRVIERALQAHQLLDIPQDEQEVPHVVRRIASLCWLPTGGDTWAGGKPLRFCFLLQFGEHLVPYCAHGGQTDAQIVAIELSHLTPQSLALRKSGNVILFHTQDEALVDPLVRAALQAIRLPQPDRAAKQVFLQALRRIYPQAQLGEGLTWEQAAFLSSNTPNQGLESLLRASHRTGKPLTARELVAQKSIDVQALSEQTLTVLDTSRVSSDRPLEGINSAYPQSILQQLAQALAAGNPSMPANVLLVGPPGTGKTEMSLITARQAGVAAYQMHSPKTGIVGETERKAELQQRVLREWVPNLAFVDEITEALPLERSDFDGDSGATRAVAAALLTALADESRRGQSLLIATTNCPWRMGAAMRSRFMAIPVLQPLAQDYPAIVLATARRVTPDLPAIGADHPAIQAAAQVFAAKGANPRHIRAALSNALLLKGELSPEGILFAAHDLSITVDRVSAIYSDLWALKACSSKSFFPWCGHLADYPFPPHLQGLVDRATGELNTTELDRRIAEYQPQANL